MAQVKISVSFESEEEKNQLLSKIDGDYTESDKMRIALGLTPRNKTGGAPIGNQNNPHGRRRNKEAI